MSIYSSYVYRLNIENNVFVMDLIQYVSDETLVFNL
jgi:hypothetical protein